MQWDEVSEDGYSADLNTLKYDQFPSIWEDYSDRIGDLLNEVDLEDSVLGGVQNFTMSCLALHVIEAGSDPRGHSGVTWHVYLCAGKPPLADIILSHPPDLT